MAVISDEMVRRFQRELREAFYPDTPEGCACTPENSREFQYYKTALQVAEMILDGQQH
jgi:hypothetical protein